MIKIVHHEEEQWVAVYRDGKLLGQGHSFTPEMLLDLLGVEYERESHYFDDWLEEDYNDNTWLTKAQHKQMYK